MFQNAQMPKTTVCSFTKHMKSYAYPSQSPFLFV